ncbi:hypothetical protein FPZ12_020285 [Amycolatopsis acidicola]|uniref:Uncharacterized protein n=1 Tax=Amycolatopsis acidicola TaxID=2596893 RepID=A0A5N0V595_9PSEU|nr:hypothetical protein [Amycolatopsis acidicola]KAA9159443.1 hypothetical protein FPZ12_020285 [Amycolatopsis acidicola]
MDWAEKEIFQLTSVYPAEADTLYHSFPLLRPTHGRMSQEFVYHAHCRELLDRVVKGTDTRPGTAAEVCCLCGEVSAVTPMRSAAIGLYARMWIAAFPDIPVFGDRHFHHEALYGSTIDDLEADARHRLAVAHRTVGAIDCTGRHHGETVHCKYAGT